MNVQLKDITVTARDGRVSHLDQVYIRGSHVRFFIVPDMLRYGTLYKEWVWIICDVLGKVLMCVILGMHRCLDREDRKDGVSVWRGGGRRLIGLEEVEGEVRGRSTIKGMMIMIEES
jgi:hypothetical protein